jgi:uroporphyrinogen decarboxylase
MTGMQRVKAALAFDALRGTPVIPQVFGFTAKMCGVPLADYLKSGDTVARCQLKARQRLGYDAVFGVMDVSVETEAVGSALCYRADHYPSVASYALTKASDLDRLSLPDPDRAGRMPEILRALGIMRGEVADDLPVIGLVLGPLTLATQLMGMEKALYLAIDAPDEFLKILDFASEVITLFGKAQLRAGAHLIMIFDPISSPAVVPAHFFREFELPLITRAFAEFKKEGSLANWLHIAGPVQPILPYYGSAGVEIVNLDYQVEPVAARRELPRTCLNGNLKSAAFIFSSPEEIQDASRRLLDAFSDQGGFILSSGCEIPPESRPENVQALVTAARSRGRCHA